MQRRATVSEVCRTQSVRMKQCDEEAQSLGFRVRVQHARAEGETKAEPIRTPCLSIN
jgi:hypothetical protein